MANRLKALRNGLAKLISGLALATNLFNAPHIKAQTPAQQGESSLEEKVGTEKYVCLRELGFLKNECGPFIQKYKYGCLDTDNTDNIYVIDDKEDCIWKIDKYGDFVNRWNRWYCSGPMPFGIAIDNNFVYVSELVNRRVQKFDLNGNPVAQWDIGATGIGDLDVDSLGNVYVSIVNVINDPVLGVMFINSVRKFDSNGNFIKEWEGIEGARIGNGIAIDKNDNVYVPGLNKIRKFSPDGGSIMDFGLDDKEPNQFFLSDIVSDNQNNIYSYDLTNNRLLKFDSNGNFITKFGQDSIKDFESVGGIATDSQDLVYISYATGKCDYTNHIKKFVKLPVVDAERGSDTVTMSFESPPNFTHRVFRSSDLENWEQINVLKSSDYQNWINANKFYSNGQKTWLQDPEVPTTQTFYKVSVQEPDFRVVDGIEYCLETDKPNYRHGEKVDMVYRVTNYREEPFQFEGHAIFTAEKDGESYFYTSARVDSSTLAHGESKEIFPRPWIIGNDAELGIYNVTGKFEGDYSVPITTTIGVVE